MHLFGQIKDVDQYQPGQQLNVEDLFKVGDLVDVAGTTIGKGFQGAPTKLIYTPRFMTQSHCISRPHTLAP